MHWIPSRWKDPVSNKPPRPSAKCCLGSRNKPKHQTNLLYVITDCGDNAIGRKFSSPDHNYFYVIFFFLLSELRERWNVAPYRQQWVPTRSSRRAPGWRRQGRRFWATTTGGQPDLWWLIPLHRWWLPRTVDTRYRSLSVCHAHEFQFMAQVRGICTHRAL